VHTEQAPVWPSDKCGYQVHHNALDGKHPKGDYRLVSIDA